MKKNKVKKKPCVYVLCCVSAGLDLINLLKKDINIIGIIGLNIKNITKNKDKISGILDMKKESKKLGIKFIGINSYSLKDEKDKNIIAKLDMDIVIIAGWQRLLPNWFLSQVKNGVINIHGSMDGISLGKGRSPQNWALMMGAKKMFFSAYFVDENIDSGKIIESSYFTYQLTDDIETSYVKAVLTTSLIIKKVFSDIINNKIKLVKQPVRSKYLPKRNPNDGYIDWNTSAKQIYDFVRSLTKPYPGARTILNGEIVKIWKIRILDLGAKHNKSYINYKPGTLIFKTFENKIIVKSKNKLMIIDDHNLNLKKYSEGSIFDSVSFKNQIKNIIKRHKNTFPDLSLNNRIIK